MKKEDIKSLKLRLTKAYCPQAANDDIQAAYSKGIQLRLMSETGEHLKPELTDSGYQLVNTGFSARLIQGIS